MWSAALDSLPLDDDERAGMDVLLRRALKQLRPERDPARARVDGMAVIADALRRQAPDGARVSPSGYLWKGRPPFLADDDLEALRREARAVRATAIRATNHLLLESSPTAREILRRPAFASFVAAAAGPTARFVPSSTYYHWYESPEDYCEPHLDIHEFGLSMLMLLEQSAPAGQAQRSAFFLCPPGQGPVEMTLAPGEALIFYSASVVHARSAPGEGERVLTVSWGLEAPAADK